MSSSLPPLPFILLYCITTWKAFQSSNAVGREAYLAVVFLLPILRERAWSFLLVGIELAGCLLLICISYFSLSSQVLPFFMGFLCQKQMSYGHKPPASIVSLCFHFITCFPCLGQLLFHAQNRLWTLLLFLLLIMLLCPAFTL